MRVAILRAVLHPFWPDVPPVPLAQVTSLPIETSTNITNAISYVFALPNGDHPLVIRRNVEITDEDIGVGATIELPGFGEHTAFGIDMLNSFQQPLNVRAGDVALLIPDLVLRDCPLLVRLSPPRAVFLPLILKDRASDTRR